MKSLLISKIDNYDYYLTDNKKTYVVNIEFYSKYKPVCGDIIYISEDILDNKNLYSFDEVYKENSDLSDYIMVIHHDRKYYFQRRYG